MPTAHELYPSLLHYQMVSLYKDPEGDKVFTAHNKTLEIHTVPSCLKLDTESEVDTLKQKIRQLEDQLKEHVVSTTVVCL